MCQHPCFVMWIFEEKLQCFHHIIYIFQFYFGLIKYYSLNFFWLATCLVIQPTMYRNIFCSYEPEKKDKFAIGERRNVSNEWETKLKELNQFMIEIIFIFKLCQNTIIWGRDLDNSAQQQSTRPSFQLSFISCTLTTVTHAFVLIIFRTNLK